MILRTIGVHSGTCLVNIAHSDGSAAHYGRAPEYVIGTNRIGAGTALRFIAGSCRGATHEGSIAESVRWANRGVSGAKLGNITLATGNAALYGGAL